MPNIRIFKDSEKSLITDPTPTITSLPSINSDKVTFRIAEDTVLPPGYICTVRTKADKEDEMFIKTSRKNKRGEEHEIPRIICDVNKDLEAILTLVNNSNSELHLKQDKY